VNIQFFQRGENTQHNGPAIFKLFTLFSFPFGPNFIREFRRRVEISSSEIQDERPLDNGHLDNELFVVGADELRDAKFQDFADSGGTQSFINGALALVRFPKAMSFDGTLAILLVVLRHEHDTMNP
jgi:hypothetical protein